MRSTNELVSIVTPVKITHNSQLSMLRRLLISINSQNYKKIELIISADESEKCHQEIIAQFEKQLNIKSFYDAPLGISANTNYAVSKASGSIIKILYQDDFLANKNAIARIERMLNNSDHAWLLSSSNHFFETTGRTEKKMVPRFAPELFQGRNTISSPSVVSFKAKKFVPFSSELQVVLDIEWYVRMLHHFGHPLIDKKVSITNGVHEYQAQNFLKSKSSRELELLRNMHSAGLYASTGIQKNCNCTH